MYSQLIWFSFSTIVLNPSPQMQDIDVHLQNWDNFRMYGNQFEVDSCRCIIIIINKRYADGYAIGVAMRQEVPESATW